MLFFLCVKQQSDSDYFCLGELREAVSLEGAESTCLDLLCLLTKQSGHWTFSLLFVFMFTGLWDLSFLTRD